MKTIDILATTGLIMGALGCGTESSPPGGPAVTPTYRPHHAQTLQFGRADNAEVVKVLPGTRRAIVVASKARRVTLIEVAGEELLELASATLFVSDATESELTHIDFGPGGTWAVITRTLISKDASGATTDCGGSLVFIDISPGPGFGRILKEVPVGPMPDAVDVSPDGKWVVSANERDVVWGKCEGLDALPGPSLSLIDVSNGVLAAVETTRIMMGDDMEREPEQVVFARDSDLIVATIQDTHEVLFVRRSELTSTTTASQGHFLSLPANSIEQDAWPDGIAGFVDGSGRELFVVAGEANDTLYIVDTTGNLVHAFEILASDVPASFPRDGSWGPLFRPDSVATFTQDGDAYVAVTLKASGAVGVWQVTDPHAPHRIVIEKVGAQESSSMSEESSLGTEGVSASSEYGFIITANEAESSISLLLP